MLALVAGAGLLAASAAGALTQGHGEQRIDLATGIAGIATDIGGIPLTSAEKLSIRVPEVSALSGDYRINDDETISLPVIGRLSVSGRTAAQVERDLATEIRRRIGREAHVTIEVSDYKPVFVNGYVNRAGAVAWKPGYTVMHGESLAGGAYRPSDTRTALPAETERARAARAAAELARVLAQLARVEAERADAEQIAMPKGLAELVGRAEADKLMRAQSTMHQSRRTAHEARIKALERARTVAEQEVQGLNDQMARLDEQIKLRAAYGKNVKALNARGLVRFERTLDEQTRISELEERRTNVVVAIAKVNGTLSGLVRELTVARHERVANLDELLVKLEREASQQRIEVDAAKTAFRRLTGQNALATTEQRANPTLSYEIVRTEGGLPRTIGAQPLTPLLPGDLLVVRLQEAPSQ